jgi:uncharacterized protein (TIGR03435 family)
MADFRMNCSTRLALAPIFLVVCGLASAQTTHFEVASIKLSDPNAKGSSIWSDNGALNATNQTVRALIATAYGIRDYQLTGGPGWVSSDRYDILAKPERLNGVPSPPDAKSRNQLWNERTRALLADRFGLVIHKETKEGQIYLLTIAKGGPKVTEATTPGDRQGISANGRRAQGFVAPMQMLADHLSSIVERPVVDKTGLAGKYNWILEWSSDTVNSPDAPPQDSGGPTIFTAVQEQLGLKLETAKGLIDIWIIDKIDRPSEN